MNPPGNGLPAALENVDTDIGAAYAYDIMDRQTDIHWTEVSEGGTPVESCQYDPIGRRIAITTGGANTTWHVCDLPAATYAAQAGGAHVIADTDDWGNLVRTYTWGPRIGNLLRATGRTAHKNPFRFSTKYQDEETGLVYYGYRFYNPEL